MGANALRNELRQPRERLGISLIKLNVLCEACLVMKLAKMAAGLPVSNVDADQDRNDRFQHFAGDGFA